MNSLSFDFFFVSFIFLGKLIPTAKRLILSFIMNYEEKTPEKKKSKKVMNKNYNVIYIGRLIWRNQDNRN